MTESNITFSFQDTVAVTKHMVYDFEDNESEVPDLECYKEQLVSQMLRSSFFQSEIKDDLDMMKIPNIIAPRLLKKQINTDCEKKSFFNKKVIHDPVTFAELAKLISKKKLDILNVDKGSHIKNDLE